MATTGMRRRGAAGATGAALMAACVLAVTLGADRKSAEAGPRVDAELLADAATPDAGTPAIAAAGLRGEVTPPSTDDVEHMCALLESCEGLPFPPQLIPADFNACVKLMTDEMTRASAIELSLTMRECGLRANSCGQFKQCALRGAAADACQGRGTRSVAGYCDADGRALSCSQGRVVSVRDCPRGGEQCAVHDGKAYCSLGPCPAELHDGDAPACSASGTRVLRCDHGRLESLDCAAFGLKCATTTHGPACAPNTPACSEGAKRCEGKVAFACHNGHEVRIDCAAAGLECAATPGDVAIGDCREPAPSSGGACSVSDAPTCDRASIKYCFAGKSRSYFCKPLFNTCERDARGVRCRR